MATRIRVDAIVFSDKKEGTLDRPVVIYWDSEDGLKKFLVEKVLDVRPAAHSEAGIQGDRYTCRFSNGQETYVFKCSDGKWYVAGK